ncbi:prepilin-type N-terminal cleavage/methylation domain-containing protein [Deinococcus psychrotolerans]|uniref:Prepilin-type N-terminal cleavage/methylation domain-containing protein n=1 Tax=Deinococcus psychrotolerans TaxID=2489213 RepID=A0A3G8YH66_9DEIO|nr:prepilin-type N-terminal cleavage/methylation domain-containing protein [Deinococcus psychrotolerans]AZI44305.1 prepilin-type N-terminal cleavage/methylation domain-containing protein [Deinococcus psychrotolerans]
MNRDEGFTLIEVLIAVVLVGLVVGSVIISSVNLSNVNARTQLQSLEVSAARAVALHFAATLPTPGQVLSGPVSRIIALNDLSEEQRNLMSRFGYTLSSTSNQLTLTIARLDVHPDPNTLNLVMQQR